jgi:hypothetical protein
MVGRDVTGVTELPITLGEAEEGECGSHWEVRDEKPAQSERKKFQEKHKGEEVRTGSGQSIVRKGGADSSEYLRERFLLLDRRGGRAEGARG